MSKKTHPFLGEISTDLIGRMLGTEFEKFKTKRKINGLAKWTDDRLEILAIVAPYERSGFVREFFAEAKQHFKTIVVWDVWNKVLEDALKRYGFVPEVTMFDGKPLEGWRWDAPNTTNQTTTTTNDNHRS